MESKELLIKINASLYLQDKVDGYMKNWEESSIHTALFVELMEWYNTIETFKTWKENSGKPRTVQLEELADCLAFTLSLINHKELKEHYTDNYAAEINYYIKNGVASSIVNKLLNNTFINYIFNIWNDKDYLELLIIILSIANKNYTLEELFNAYASKSKINIDRQKNGY